MDLAEVESVICVSHRPKSGSVGRTFPTQKIAALRAVEGRSVGRLRLKNSPRYARGLSFECGIVARRGACGKVLSGKGSS